MLLLKLDSKFCHLSLRWDIKQEWIQILYFVLHITKLIKRIRPKQKWQRFDISSVAIYLDAIKLCYFIVEKVRLLLNMLVIFCKNNVGFAGNIIIISCFSNNSYGSSNGSIRYYAVVFEFWLCFMFKCTHNLFSFFCRGSFCHTIFDHFVLIFW